MLNDDCGCGQTRRDFLVNVVSAAGVAMVLAIPASAATNTDGSLFPNCSQRLQDDMASCKATYPNDLAMRAACYFGAYDQYIACVAAQAAKNFADGIQRAIDWINQNPGLVAVGVVIGIVVIVGVGVATGGIGFAPALAAGAAIL